METVYNYLELNASSINTDIEINPSNFTSESLKDALFDAMAELNPIRDNARVSAQKIDTLLKKHLYRNSPNNADYLLFRKWLFEICEQDKSYYYAYIKLLQYGNESGIPTIPKYEMTKEEIGNAISEELDNNISDLDLFKSFADKVSILKLDYENREEFAVSKLKIREKTILDLEAWRDNINPPQTTYFDDDVCMYPLFKHGWDSAIDGIFICPKSIYKFFPTITEKIKAKYPTKDPSPRYYYRLLKVAIDEVVEGMAQCKFYYWLQETHKPETEHIQQAAKAAQHERALNRVSSHPFLVNQEQSENNVVEAEKKYPTIDKTKYDSSLIFEKFVNNEFECSEADYDKWLVKGIDGKHPIKSTINKGQLKKFIQTITNNVDDTKEAYFKSVFQKIIPSNITASNQLPKAIRDKLKLCEIKK